MHALQGDGVVDQTAIETAAENLEIRYDLHPGVALRAPLVDTSDSWIVIGFAADLDDALTGCLRELIGWLAAATELSESEAYALASMAVSFRVTQYAHQTASAYTSTPPKAVHAASSPRPSSRPPSMIRFSAGCDRERQRPVAEQQPGRGALRRGLAEVWGAWSPRAPFT